MGTLAELKQRIALELRRNDLSDDIANAIKDAIRFHERTRFWFNQSRSITFSTTFGQDGYGVADNPLIPGFVRIDDIFLPRAVSIHPLTRYEVPDFEIVAGATSNPGKPSCWTYTEGAIRLYPIPDAVYAMRIIAHYRLPGLIDDSDSNAWTTEAEELIRTHAKLMLFLDVLEDDTNVNRMQLKLPLLLDALKAETSARMSTGRIVPTSF